MAGSPAYLALLDEQAALKQTDNTSFEDLYEAWEMLTQSNSLTRRDRLLDIADIAFDIIAIETGKPRSEVIQDARQLHVAKNAGYAGADNPDAWANFRLSQAFHIQPFHGVLVRMSDKFIRTQNLRANPANDQVGESLIDTLRDLAAYALIAVCLIDEEVAA